VQKHSEGAAEPVVTILFKNCNQYRVPFFWHLRKNLEQKGIELRLVVGGGLPEDLAKGDIAAQSLPWAEERPFRSFTIMGHTMLWQPGLDLARSSDLIITEQASKQLFNVVLSYGQRLLGTRHAFWGHGKNFQTTLEGSAGEGLKRRLTKRAHWFFAYNSVSADAAVEFGMHPDRVTSVMNSTDTEHIRDVRMCLPPSTADSVRAELGMGDGPAAMYLGGIYRHKRPEFLVEAAEHLRSIIPDFEMIVMGSGSEVGVIEDAAKRHQWFHHLGARYGDERIRLASVADVQLMPGLVGLNVVDGFALGIPTITTDVDYHSPEIEYLLHDVNGLIATKDSTAADFAKITAEVLNNPEDLERLKAGANLAGKELSVQDMAQRFADGIVQALRENS
jgi:glycosyltransferase involved in cell wall biosynthesis